MEPHRLMCCRLLGPGRWNDWTSGRRFTKGGANLTPKFDEEFCPLTATADDRGPDLRARSVGPAEGRLYQRGLLARGGSFRRRLM